MSLTVKMSMGTSAEKRVRRGIKIMKEKNIDEKERELRSG